MRRLFRSPLGLPVITTFLIVVLVGVLAFGRVVHAGAVIAPDVLAQAATGPVNVEVHLGFTPEAFNVMYLQQFANAVSVQGESAMLFGATEAGIQSVASQLWVDSITLIG